MASEGHRSRFKCPECRSQLLLGEGLIWCSNVGSVCQASCSFGVKEHVTAEEFKRRIKMSKHGLPGEDKKGSGKKGGGGKKRMVSVIALLFVIGCADPPAAPAATATAHVYTNKTGGSVIYCPEELDPVPTEWDYNGTAEISEDDILEICELE